MKNVTICVGTSCHLKGSHHVVDSLDHLIQKHGLEDLVEITASFCMGRCQGNIGAVIDGEDILDLTEDNVESVFKREILDRF